jgi:pimeloyl-ACP methyl ester carboxylesterase
MMQEATEARELIVLESLDVTVRGTYHKTFDERAGTKSVSIERDRIGVLFLNSLSPTRAGKGDSAVYWADSFAERGYPCFRVDLPWFGDSDGDPSTELLSFINSGGYAPIVTRIARDLISRYRLSGVVLVGLCAGAVTAMYTAAVCRDCRGLILLDPYFSLPLESRSKAWEKLTHRFLIRVTYDRMRALQKILFGKHLPDHSNLPLLRRWKKLVSTGLPILLFKPASTNHRRGEFDYLKRSLEESRLSSQIVIKEIQGAGHTFANRLGREGVRQHTEEWLNARFPLLRCKEGAVTSSTSECDPNTSPGLHGLITSSLGK